MDYRLYVVYDRVAEEAGPIFCAVNDGVARRQYRGILQNVSPVDMDSYKLYCLGMYNSEEMTVEGAAVPMEVAMEVRQNLLAMEENK